MFVIETSLATERQTVLDLKAALQKAEEEVWLAKKEAQLVREAAEAEKKASYQLGAEETEARLSEELPEVCRDYCSISWAHALDAAGIPTDCPRRSSSLLRSKRFLTAPLKLLSRSWLFLMPSLRLIRPKILPRSPSPRVLGQIPKPKRFLLLSQSRKRILLLRLSF